ncbi:hypothetical protein BH23ACT6_BH23ACT6_17970 [soil metagenome]
MIVHMTTITTRRFAPEGGFPHPSTTDALRTTVTALRERKSIALPVLCLLLGCAALAWSAVLIPWAGTDAGTTTVVRCLLAATILLPLAVREVGRKGAPTQRFVLGSALAGAVLGVDFMLATQSLILVGAGVSSVLLNTQILAFPLLARFLQGQQVPRAFVLSAPLLLVGVALVGGLGQAGGHTILPLSGLLMGAGAGIAYAVYLYVSRQGAIVAPGRPLTGLVIACLAATASSAVIAVPTTGLNFDLTAHSWLWLILLAVIGQAGAWLLVGAGSARLPAHMTAMLLAIHPVLAVALGVFVLGESLSVSQVAGSLLVLMAILVGGSAAPRSSPDAPRSSPDVELGSNGRCSTL